MKKKYRLSLKKKWVFSYIIIITIIMSICSYAFFTSFKIIKEQTESTYMLSLKQLESILEEKISTIFNQCVQLNFNQQSNNILYGIDNRTVKVLAEINVLDDIKNINMANNFIENISVFYHKEDIVITSEGKYSFKDYFEQYNLDYEPFHNVYGFKDFLKEKHINDIKILTNKNTHTNDAYFLTTLPLQNPKDNKGTVIVRVDQNVIRRLIEDMYLFNEGIVLITDNEGEILLPAQDQHIDSRLLVRGMFDESGIIKEKINGQFSMVTYIKSDKLTYMYITGPINESKYLKHFFIIILFIFIAVIIIGILLSYLFSRNNYQPLQHILSLMPQMGSDDSIYEYIENTLNELITTKNDYQSNRLHLRNNLFSKLIKTKDNTEIISELEIKFGVIFKQDTYSIFLMDIERVQEFQNEDLIYFILNNVFGELLKPIGQSYLFPIAYRKYACIINYNSYNQYKENENIAQSLLVGRNLLAKKMKIDLTIALSSSETKIQRAKDLFEEAREAMRHKIIKKPDEVLIYSKLKLEKKMIDNHNHLLEKCIAFKKTLDKKDFENAFAKVSEIYEILTDPIKSTESIGYRVFGLTEVLVGILRNFNNWDKENYYIDNKEFNQLYKCHTIYELKDTFHKILTMLTIAVEDYKHEENNTLIAEIEGYIKNNYTDVDLSVNGIAEYYNIGPSHLSKIYKKATGMNLLNYIHEYRLEQAKIMLKSGYSVKDTGIKVGYINSMTFIRVFKKYVGITPGKYKEV